MINVVPKLPARAGRPAYWVRTAVQVSFIFWSVLIGIEFHYFVEWLEGPMDAQVVLRPTAVEAFLPISSLVSLVQLLKTGVVNHVHPAGLVIFVLTLVLAVLMRRGFCSWVCPVGTLSEWMMILSRRLFLSPLQFIFWSLESRIPGLLRRIDIPLRSIRYLLLGFFLYIIIFRMPGPALAEFANSPYNRLADVKMYYFFAQLSVTAATVIGSLLVLSFFFPYFWCRYLCPYGALLGLFSAASPLHIHRDEERCIACGECAKACPNRIAVDTKRAVRTVECFACYTCVKTCGSIGTIRMSWARSTRSFPPVVYAVLFVGALLFGTHAARVMGYWHTDTPPMMYKALHMRIDQMDNAKIDVSKMPAKRAMSSP